MTLNLFPARVAIGTVKTSTGDVPVMMTPEFFRALTDLLTRVGGPSGTSTTDIELMAAQSQPPAIDFSQFADLAALQTADSPAATAQLARGISDALAVQLGEARALVAELSKQTRNLQALSGYTDPFRVNWEYPGRIGFFTPNSGAFTTLTASSTVTLSPANANVTISPTGTGTVTMAPATAGTINNMSIGATTARAGRFTTLETTLSAGGASTKAWILTASGAYSVGLAPTSTEGILEYNAGTGAAAFFGHRFLVNGTERFKIDGNGLTNATGSLRSTGAFACNGNTPQTAAASGGAVATTGATDIAPFGYTTAAQADRIVTLLNTIRSALVANGIMS